MLTVHKILQTSQALIVRADLNSKCSYYNVVTLTFKLTDYVLFVIE